MEDTWPYFHPPVTFKLFQPICNGISLVWKRKHQCLPTKLFGILHFHLSFPLPFVCCLFEILDKVWSRFNCPNLGEDCLHVWPTRRMDKVKYNFFRSAFSKGEGKTTTTTTTKRYNYDTIPFMIPEVDGVRILTNDRCEFLQRVPGTFPFVCLFVCLFVFTLPFHPILPQTDSQVNIFNIGSTAASALLFDAWDHFEVQLDYFLKAKKRAKE